MTMMRNIYKVLDPLGYILPSQQLWDKKREWDEQQLPNDLLNLKHSWEAELEHLQKVTLPRCYSSLKMDHSSSVRNIHVFSDASEQACGSVVYLEPRTNRGGWRSHSLCHSPVLLPRGNSQSLAWSCVWPSPVHSSLRLLSLS